MPSIKEKGSRPVKPQLDPLRKLSFGAINRRANNAKTAYPILPDPNGQLAIITARIIERTAQIEALDGALAIDDVGVGKLDRGRRFPHPRRAEHEHLEALGDRLGLPCT